MVYGYARVSSTEQNLDRQLIQLREYVEPQNIVIDKQSGKNLIREGYQALKGSLGLRQGDILYICSLDRLSRSKADIKKELEWFKDHNIRLMILDLPTSLVSVPQNQEWIIEMINNILIEVISSIAERERITIRERQRQGINAAKAKGKHLGRPPLNPPNWNEIYFLWKENKITATEAAKRLNISPSSFYRFLKKRKESQENEKSK